MTKHVENYLFIHLNDGHFMDNQSRTQEELGHSVADYARATGHDCTCTNPLCVESGVAISSEKKNVSW